MQEMAQTKEQKAAFRAKRARQEQNSNFKPRGVANRAAYEGMTEKLEKKTKQIPLLLFLLLIKD